MLTTSGAFAEQAVTVLYAGSLVGLMERSVGPAFKQQTGEEFRGHAGGSQELAKKVKEGALQGDVFISADPRRRGQREAIGKVIAVAGVKPHAAVVSLGHNTIAIVLDFVNPARPGRRFRGRAGKAGFDALQLAL
jgi:ABC-type molybdate transport system substrate-binding protein